MARPMLVELQRIDRVLPEIQAHIRRRAPGRQGGMVHLIEIIKHSDMSLQPADRIMLQCKPNNSLGLPATCHYLLYSN